MASLQIGKYKRPGIFVEEYDQSIIASQTVQGITNLVIGVSKKGPINTPILISNTSDLQTYFGAIDRNLERKGSYFHRTIAQMVQSSPVYAINLLATDDTLDKIEYAPLSTSTDKTNDDKKSGAYRRFFNNTGFWKKDADSFLTLASGNANYGDRILNLTNMSGNYITVFVFKSTITGYNRTMLDWYGSVEAMPTYVYATDYVSDYMVDVVVLSGDWSNYANLSVDIKWSKYFDSTGLRKTQVNNFVNDQNVTLLKYYQGLSFIPYFKDINGSNIFIETAINQDTDSTGLFCAFNTDAFDTDYPNGKIDLIGNNLVNSDDLTDTDITDINFLSYKDTIIQNVTVSNTLLDTPGNVTGIDSGLFSSGDLGNTIRTAWYEEDRVEGLAYLSKTFSSSEATFKYSTSTPNNGVDTLPYVIIGGNKINITGTTSYTISASDYGSFSTTQSYYATFKVDTTGAISKVTTTTTAAPTVAATDIVLGYAQIQIQGGNIKNVDYTNVNIDSGGFKELTLTEDYTITSIGDSANSFTVTFATSSGIPDASNYLQYRRIKRFNSFRNILESTNFEKSTIMLDLQDGNDFVKVSLANMEFSSVISTTQNKSFTIKTNLGLSTSVMADVVTSLEDNGIVIYTVDNELLLSDYQMITTNTIPTGSSPSSVGVVAKYSDLYQYFYNGQVNTGDYLYNNISDYTLNTVEFKTVSGNSYVVLGGTSSAAPFVVANYLNGITVPASTLNKGTLTIADFGENYATDLGYGSAYYAYKVEEAVTAETLTDVVTIYDFSIKYYLSMYVDGSNNLTVNITDNSLSTWQEGLTIDNNQTFNIKSNKSNYQETVQIETPSGYTQVANKVLVNATRYSEVIAGDFLEAYVDTEALVDGQTPKRLTRILTKKVYAADSTLVELTCDARIFTELVGSTYQTMRYSSLDNYVSTYKAISLKGFRIREASLPDGTDTRQSAILDLVAKGTPLFRAVTNKEAIDFRYLIDSFGLGLTELSKQQLVDICGERLDCLGFLNMPSMKEFRKSSNPYFVNSEGVLQTSFIAAGGDIDRNPAFLYSFGEGRGTTCVGYFLPYVTVSDNGRPTDVPPAMFVATTYMRKQNSNITSTVPWTIAAGVVDGKVTGIAGLEMDFDPTDIENLNGAQMNPVVIKKNRGWAIETENTGQTLVKTALSYLHVRELLIELERELTEMLKNFQWKFNTVNTRAEIKNRADGICAKFANKNGLYAFFNKCDSENNTNTIIDNQIGVLDTYVEPIKGMAVIVNNVTVLKTGGIKSIGFQ